jgi:adenine-specific DNA-methyltransferase
VIWERMKPDVEQALAELNEALRGHPTPYKVGTGGRAGQKVDFRAPEGSTMTLPSGEDAPAGGLLEWEVPHELPEDWPAAAREPLEAFWESRVARQTEIDESIARTADVELLYDRPYEDRGKVRVAGPFTVESLSPHRVVATDEGEAWDEIERPKGGAGARRSCLTSARAGATSPRSCSTPCAPPASSSGTGKTGSPSGVFHPGPGSMSRPRGGSWRERWRSGRRSSSGRSSAPWGGRIFVAAAREAVDARFDVLIACAFAYDAHASDFSQLGALQVLRARMNPDLHMADELKNTGTGNLFVVFGEPDIEVREVGGERIEVEIKGVDVFNTGTGEVRSGGTEDIAAWFIDTDYDEESFFVRHAYFLGAHDPYKALKTTLKAEIDEEAWATLYRATSRPFPKPSTGRFAVKVINHLGDEVMKVFQV